MQKLGNDRAGFTRGVIVVKVDLARREAGEEAPVHIIESAKAEMPPGIPESRRHRIPDLCNVVSVLPDAAALVVLRPVVIRDVVANAQSNGVVPPEAGGAHAGVGARAGAALEHICRTQHNTQLSDNS